MKPSRPSVPTLGFFPDYSRSNPYQQIIYSRLGQYGFNAVPVPDHLRSLVPEGFGPDLSRYTLHIHWTTPIVQRAPGPIEALARLQAFAHHVETLQSHGASIIWTIHNAVPHECPYWSLEVELCRLLAARADVIHIMDRSTTEAVEHLYELPPEKLALVPHPSYIDVYPDLITRDEARDRLGLHSEEVVLTMMGELRPYKGLDLLLEAFDTAWAQDPRLRLVVVGRQQPGLGMEDVVRACALHPAVQVHTGFVPADDVQIWLRASDLMVLPYRGVLNSGAFHLALTFGLPVLVPRAGSLGRLADDSFVRTFEPGSERSLAEAVLAGVRDLLGPESRRAAHRAAAKVAPADIAAEFGTLLRTRVFHQL